MASAVGVQVPPPAPASAAPGVARPWNPANAIACKRIDAGHRTDGRGPQARVHDHLRGRRDRVPGERPAAAAAAERPPARLPAGQGTGAAPEEAARACDPGRGARGGCERGCPPGAGGPSAPASTAAQDRPDLARRDGRPRVPARPRDPARCAGAGPGRAGAHQAHGRDRRHQGRGDAAAPGAGAAEVRGPGRAACRRRRRPGRDRL